MKWRISVQKNCVCLKRKHHFLHGSLRYGFTISPVELHVYFFLGATKILTSRVVFFFLLRISCKPGQSAYVSGIVHLLFTHNQKPSTTNIIKNMSINFFFPTGASKQRYILLLLIFQCLLSIWRPPLCEYILLCPLSLAYIVCELCITKLSANGNVNWQSETLFVDTSCSIHIWENDSNQT